jgi:hypothetical protein
VGNLRLKIIIKTKKISAGKKNELYLPMERPNAVKAATLRDFYSGHQHIA